MAGGKETPRQKMIGMMYIVLTALLALQVSSAIMEKFKFLDDSLKYANEQADKNNIITEKKIEKAVADAGNKGTDMAVLKKAQGVRKESQEVKDYIDKLRKDIIALTDGYEEPGNEKSMYKGAKEETKIEVFMVGAEGKKSGAGYKLKEEVNKFVADVNKIFGKQKFKDLALDAKDDPRIWSKEQKKKDFAELNFAQTPMVAAMAVLSNLEAEVLKLETEALAELAAEVGAADLKFDQVVAMVRPSSKVVAAGTKYEADMFLAASASTITPTMKAKGAEIKVDPSTKIGKVAFTAQAGAYDKEGNSKQTWTGEIKFKFKGKDTIFPIKEEYIVAKPVIQVQSASVSALYKNCGNELNIQVPALGSTYNPSFSASGAIVKTSSKKGLITVIPTGIKPVTINVSSGGNKIGSETFKVRGIPKPEIVALDRGKPVDEKRGVSSPGPRSLVVKALPDESFKAFLPKDARYNVAEWECILVRGKRPVSTKKLTSENANLSSFASQAQPGDRILIEVKKVYRTNYLNKREEVSIGTVIKNIPLN